MNDNRMCKIGYKMKQHITKAERVKGLERHTLESTECVCVANISKFGTQLKSFE